jgi:Fic family protein
MRLPQFPPDLTELLENPERFLTLMHGAEEEVKRKDRYLHWDELRHRQPPEGLSPQEWWAGLKIRRMSQQQSIPLTDLRGAKFNFWLTPRMFEQLHDIDLTCGGSVEGSEAVTHPETRDRYYVSSLVEESITSSQLEGAAVTRSVAKEMLRRGLKPRDSGEQMILNNFLTMREISGWKKRDLTPELVLEIHRMISRGTLEDPAKEGVLRASDDQVRVEDDSTGEIVHVPPKAEELPARLQALCDFANERKMEGYLHPVVRSIILHFWLAYDHPFVDGNGRTARAVFYWSMLRHSFWLFEFVSISQQILQSPKKYYRAFLHTESDGNDLNYFILHQLGMIQQAIDKLHEYIRRKSDELAEMRGLLNNRSGFNHRQLALLRYALKHPTATFTVASHRHSHNVVPQTARTDLELLLGLGLLKKAKVGKGFLYAPVADFPNRIRELPDAFH